MASSSATFDSLQERLSALQETTNSLKELIKRLATIEFQPGSVPLTNSSEDNVASELSAEIISILREEEDDLELRQEEIIDLRTTKQTESRKIRLKEAASRIEEELKAYGLPLLSLHRSPFSTPLLTCFRTEDVINPSAPLSYPPNPPSGKPKKSNAPSCSPPSCPLLPLHNRIIPPPRPSQHQTPAPSSSPTTAVRSPKTPIRPNQT